MSTVITDANILTCEYLTETLSSTTDCSGAEITSVNQEEPKNGQMSITGRLHLEWTSNAPETAPKSVWLKTAHPAILPTNKREVQIYAVARPEMEEPPLVKCFDAQYCPTTGSYHVILEDISNTHQSIETELPPTAKDAELAVDALAAFHAFWWDHPMLGSELGQHITEFDIRRLVGYSASHFARIADRLDDRLSSKQRAAFEMTFDQHPRQLRERIATARHLTLVHGDSHNGNFFLPKDHNEGRAFILDWQTADWIWQCWCGVSDLAYMIIRLWSPERRRAMQEHLLRRYLEQVSRHGVIDYRWEDLWDDYRTTAMWNLYVVIHHAYTRGPQYWYPQLERATAAFYDLSCEELLH